MKLRKYQHRIINELVNKPNVCLSVGMGLGKTAAVLHFLEETRRRYPFFTALIVAPKRVAETVWLQEAEKWQLWELAGSMCLVAGSKAEKERKAAPSYTANVKVVSRDNVKLFEGQEFNILIIDELTSFKNLKAQRTKDLLSIKADRKIGMTGTFAPNGLIDIFAQLAVLDIADAGKNNGNFWAWLGRYFQDLNAGRGVPYKRYVLRSGETAESVVEVWRDRILTLTTEDYLELPPMIEQVVPFQLSPAERKAYDGMVSSLHFELPDLDDFTVSEKARFAKIQTLASGFVYDTDGDYGEPGGVIRIGDTSSRVALAVDMCLRCAAEGERVLLFYNYRETGVMFGEACNAAGLRVASVKGNDNRWLHRWNAGEIDVLVANPASAGHGLNLQGGGHIILWLELTYNYELFAQANARLHRTGQTQQVVVYYLVAAETVDKAILSALRRKHNGNREVEEVTKENAAEQRKPTEKDRFGLPAYIGATEKDMKKEFLF